MTRYFAVSALLVPLTLGACAVAPPTGPTVMALPRQGEDFSEFQAQDASCRNYAAAQIGYGSPQQAANQSAVGSAVVGTALGAAAGAALGAVGGNAGAGAAVGGAGGLLMGSAVGGNNARASAGSLQHGYDVAYTQCMVAAGNTVQQPTYAAPYPYPYGGAPVYAYPPGYYGPSVGIGIGIGGGRWHRW